MQKSLFNQESVEQIISIAIESGNAVMDIYKSVDLSVDFKEDKSPLTAADLASNKIIVKKLSAIFPDDLVVFEEGTKELRAKAMSNNRFWLIDPLDGTKEFINRNGEFTINIGLIVDKKPVFGVVYIPDKDVVYWGGDGFGAHKRLANKDHKISVSKNPTPKVIIASRSHMTPDTAEFVSNYPDAQIINAGSSLKICYVAEGRADIYPRFNGSFEWDTAAADAVLRNAGGVMLTTDFKDFDYQKERLFNPGFICSNGSVKLGG